MSEKQRIDIGRTWCEDRCSEGHGVESGRCINFNTIHRLSEALGVEPVVALRSDKKVDKGLIDYVMTVILELAHRHGLSIREASNYIGRFKGFDFLTEFYDVEHTLSFNDCVEDLTLVCQNHGGGIVETDMKTTIDTNTARFLFEGISADVVRYLVERNGMDLQEAIATFHNSETFEKLEDFETGLYIESPAYVYDMLLSELKNGRLV